MMDYEQRWRFLNFVVIFILGFIFYLAVTGHIGEWITG